MKISLILLAVLFPVLAGALVAGPVKLSGKVLSFDDSQLTLESKDEKIEIPKEFVAEKKLKVGQQMDVLVSVDQFSKVKVIKKAKK